ncbi:hypothetical protein FB45DRAFT_923488 [Roridomyces roridus]|uniref:Uncharacterized protein n=1 Tax=Roridomyces roridus TaxID=1738132 RepID=A0AAD7BL79_9AGAR|nr:hypothetical protein FB45DRAFT_923488 [Roridomyces roridus]
MWLQLLSLLALGAVVQGQGDDTISVSTNGQTLDSGLATFNFLWKGEAGHNLNNISLELVQGSAEDKGTSVIDIIATNVSSVDSTSIIYSIHPGISAGTYHTRINGTIYNGDQILSGSPPVSSLSNTFSIADSGIPCSAGTFTPVTSLTDPAYQPLRFTSPLGASQFPQADVTGPGSLLSMEIGVVDTTFGTFFGPATVEVINTQNGFNAGVQHTNLAAPFYQTSNITLNPGPWKIRMNFSIFAPAPYPGTFSLQSEQFFVVADENGTPSCPDSSESGSGSSASTPTPTPTNPVAGGGPTNSAGAPAGSSATGPGASNPLQSGFPLKNDAAAVGTSSVGLGWASALFCFGVVWVAL